jgi:oxygen-independent coproporphyrinogen-3 oxidase
VRILLPPELLGEALDYLFAHFPLLPGAEITCEANPGTLSEGFLRMLRAKGVNRLSLGAQAKQEPLLRTLGRIHDWDQVEDSVKLARNAGFGNLNIDLMFGLPNQSAADWQESLGAALALSPQHLSLYGLILEEGTPLFETVSHGVLSLPDDAAERAMYKAARRMTRDAGMRQYEISNFALPGYECRHNLGYWQGSYYLGVGAAAHSCMACDPKMGAYARFGNPPSLDEYLQKMGEGVFPLAEYREIPPREAEFETLMLGLRVLRGVSDLDFTKRHGRTIQEAFGDKIGPLKEKGLLAIKAGHLKLTRRGMDVQNSVLVDLMD